VAGNPPPTPPFGILFAFLRYIVSRGACYALFIPQMLVLFFQLSLLLRGQLATSALPISEFFLATQCSSMVSTVFGEINFPESSNRCAPQGESFLCCQYRRRVLGVSPASAGPPHFPNVQPGLATLRNSPTPLVAVALFFLILGSIGISGCAKTGKAKPSSR